MKSLPVLAAAIACAIGTIPASAQERGYRRDGGAVQKHYRDGGRRDWHRGQRYRYSPRFELRWSTPYYRPYRHYDPYWYYPAPAYVYPLWPYEPEPLVVERIYEPPRYYEEVERPEPYRERSYAQAEPARPAPRAPVPPPRPERYTLSAQELFEFDKATLRMPQPRLDEIAEAMRRDTQIEGVTITGYTDRLGTEAYNLALSQRRANAVRDYLVSKGVAASRLRAVGRGEANPVVQCDDAGKAELIRCLEPNRRVEVEKITVERRVPGS